MTDKQLIRQLQKQNQELLKRVDELEDAFNGSCLIIDLERATVKGCEAEIKMLRDLLAFHNITAPVFIRLGQKDSNDR
jgi:hypothetical protein